MWAPFDHTWVFVKKVTLGGGPRLPLMELVTRGPNGVSIEGKGGRWRLNSIKTLEQQVLMVRWWIRGKTVRVVCTHREGSSSSQQPPFSPHSLRSCFGHLCHSAFLSCVSHNKLISIGKVPSWVLASNQNLGGSGGETGRGQGIMLIKMMLLLRTWRKLVRTN